MSLCTMRFACVVVVTNLVTATSRFAGGADSRQPRAPHPTELPVARVLPIEGVRDPSGLTTHDGVLYSVSDKCDDTIWRVEVDEQAAVFREHVRFQYASTSRMDFEGISTDSSGTFYLLSESHRIVVRVSPRGEAAIEMSFGNEGEQSGFFATPGAGPEGLLWMKPGLFLIAAERQPAGLIRVKHERPRQVTVFKDKGQVPHRIGRPADITGLFLFRGEIWCLARNAESIFRVSLQEDGQWERKEVFSFASAVRSPKVAYHDMRYGHAEGLAMDDHFIWVVLDNNNEPRRDDEADRRPLLFAFRWPDR